MIKFNVKASALKKALEIVGIAPPMETKDKNTAGYLFILRGDGSAFVYSQNPNHVARAPLAIEVTEGEGVFIIPAIFIPPFSQMDDGEDIQFETGEREGQFYVSWKTSSGSEGDRPSFDPQTMRPVDDLDPKDGIDVPAVVLRRAITTVRGAAVAPDDKSTEEEVFKTLQVFDSSKAEWAAGDGTMFATDGKRASYFFCEALKGKGIAIHGRNLPQIVSFLAKSDGNVNLRFNQNWTFLTNTEGQTLGWVKHATTFPKYSFYQEDPFSFKVNTSFLARQLAYMKSSMTDGKQDRVRFVYKAEGDSSTIQFYFKEPKHGTVKSSPILAVPETDEAKAKSLEITFNINHLLELVSSIENNEATMSITVHKAKKEGQRDKHYLRVIDPFTMDASGKVLPGDTGEFKCRMTRFIPTMT